MNPNSRMMIVSTDAITGRRMLSSEIFMRRAGDDQRVARGQPLDDLYPRFCPQPGFYGYGVGLAALIEEYLVHAHFGDDGLRRDGNGVGDVVHADLYAYEASG